MSRKTKWASWIVCIILLSMVAAACSNGGNTGDQTGTTGVTENNSTNSNETGEANEPSETNEPSEANEPSGPVTLSYMIDTEGGRTIDGTKPVPLEFGNRVNVKLDFMSVPYENYVQKLTTMMIGAEMPDVVTFTRDSKFIYDEYASRFLVPLDEYMAAGKMPNLQKWIEKYPQFAKIMTSPDGHIYGTPIINDGQNVSSAVHVRADLLRSQGMEPTDVQTLDDWYAAFRAIKAADPEIHWVQRNGWQAMGRNFLPIFGAAQTLWFDEENQTYKISATTENYKVAIQFLADMYREKILHPDFLLNSEQVFHAELSRFKGGMLADSVHENMENRRLQDTDPVIEEAQLLPPIINGKRAKLPATANIDISRVTAISKTSPNIDAAIAMLDYGYSEEGVELLWYGREGLDWREDATQPNGKHLLTAGAFNLGPDGKPAPGFPDNDSLGKIGYGIYFVWPPEAIAGTWSRTKDDPIAHRIPEINKYFQENGVIGSPLPQLSFNQEELDVLKQVSTPLFTMIDENAVRFILGQRDMNEWGAFVEEIKNAGAEQVENVYNSALARFNKF